MTVTGLFEAYDPAPEGEGVRASLLRIRRNKANPRTREYMKTLFTQSFEGERFIDIAEDPGWAQAAQGSDQIVFLYPDSTGLGSGRLNAQTKEWLEEGRTILILNGRWRLFRLDARQNRSLRIRRFMEQYLIGEAVFAFLFVLLSAVFFVEDRIRGRV